MKVTHRAHFFDARNPGAEHPSLISDPIPKFIYKKMERRWAQKFAAGSVKLGSLFHYRSIKDESRMIVDPHEGLEATMVTPELAASPMFLLMANGKPPEVGSLLFSQDDRRLVFCASESIDIPSEALPVEYDTWIQIDAKPAIVLIHDALVKRVPDVEGPAFKKVIYDPTIDGHDNYPPLRPFSKLLDNGFGLHDRWFTKRTRFRAQGEVRVGWLADPQVCSNPIAPLEVAGLQDVVKVLD